MPNQVTSQVSRHSSIPSRKKRKKNVFTTEVIHEAAQRIFRGRLRPFLQSKGYATWQSLVGQVYEKSLSLRDKFNPALGTPVGYLATAAAHQIFRDLSEEVGALDIPRDRPGDSVKTRRWKEAARASISLETVEVGSDDDSAVAGDDDEPAHVPVAADQEEMPIASGNPRTRDPSAVDDEDDELPPVNADEVDVEGLANLVIALQHSGDPVLAALAGALQSPRWTQVYHVRGAWARAVGIAAKALGKSAEHVRAHFLRFVEGVALKSHMPRKYVAEQLAEIDIILKLNGTRGPYAEREKKDGESGDGGEEKPASEFCAGPTGDDQHPHPAQER